jgi:hypothetical protein
MTRRTRTRRDEKPARVERNILDNNFIHDGSHIFRGSQGVWIGRSSFNQITHNEISDFQHLGISVGHSWGYVLIPRLDTANEKFSW